MAFASSHCVCSRSIGTLRTGLSFAMAYAFIKPSRGNRSLPSAVAYRHVRTRDDLRQLQTRMHAVSPFHSKQGFVLRRLRELRCSTEVFMRLGARVCRLRGPNQICSRS